ncbi:hypothetical protein LEAN103870_00695 [Legionella anisa]|uniref:hypothetical protein n=1 Tax=Legionella anisa TaxID=28082 RepID=UPI000347826F|nr:hypothetical protein [Legionella anisa]KTC67165.1 hypothetical protein Lani_3510 [Legionella anisa]MCW8426161.1 hypothetical protein [Legionella anisa]MCW8448472.1 hypothetical protein [Legionella anisa]
MGNSKRWEQVKANAEKEKPKVDNKLIDPDLDLDFDAIDTAKELRKIEKITHDPNNTRDEMDALRNTLVGGPVRLPAQLEDQENNLGVKDTPIETQDLKPNSPKV